MKTASMRMLGFALVLALVGCGEAQKIENKITCASVCNRYKDCFDSNYDVDKCKDSCEAEADANNDKQQRLDACDSCIDGESCTGAAFNCSTQCAGIIIQ